MIKYTLIPRYCILFVVILSVGVLQSCKKTNNNVSGDLFIEDLIDKMTIDEKIGQMSQMCFSTITLNGSKELDLNADLFREAVLDYHVGSFLSGTGSAEQWADFVTKMQKIAVEESRLGIPLIIGIDHVHGANYVDEGTMLPHNINLGCTFDTALAVLSAEVTARETIGLGLNWNFAPVLDVGKNAYWPRLYETYGEDPLVTSRMGASFINAYQKPYEGYTHRLAACAKHFIGYSDPVSGWDRTPAIIDDQTLYEDFLPPFEAAVESGVLSVMLNSGEVNGVPVHVSDRLVKGLLREEMGYDGVIVTDIKDIAKVYENHHAAHSEKQAVLRSVNAGIDVSMSCTTYNFQVYLKELLEEGKISEKRINESVRRILTLKKELGLFDNPYPDKTATENIGSKENLDAAFEIAASSLVLLKNENDFLPMGDCEQNILVTGIGANSKKMLNGAWTLEWEGAEEARQPSEMLTLSEAIESEFPASNIISYSSDLPGGRAAETELLDIMKSVDVIVLTLGEQPYSEFKGNISDLTMDDDQVRLAKLAQKSGTPVVFILMEGRPRLITEIEDMANAIVFAGYPGQMGGNAIAAILSGSKNPSGKLAFSYPKYPGHTIPYYHKATDKAQNLYEFGHGLSYSNIKYSGFSVSDTVFSSESDSIHFSFDLTNNSNISGDEIILCYFKQEKGMITRPVKKLFYFDKVRLESNQKKRIEVAFPLKDVLSYPDKNNIEVLEEGYYTLMTDRFSQKILFNKSL
ncbi:MAG: glycoside hydrolase family 3 C-terminal domain-containing protein [Prolixibacteraceae bacterium]|nr:glycoside hydrolase family 3 C-terminal domain-containing protein [Prolixibacteraceae bacterium]